MTEIEHSFMWLKNILTLERRVQDGGTPVHPWLIHVNVWQKPPQDCNYITIKINYLIKKK